jgi:hypothetical protein
MTPPLKYIQSKGLKMKAGAKLSTQSPLIGAFLVLAKSL